MSIPKTFPSHRTLPYPRLKARSSYLSISLTHAPIEITYALVSLYYIYHSPFFILCPCRQYSLMRHPLQSLPLSHFLLILLDAFTGPPSIAPSNLLASLSNAITTEHRNLKSIVGRWAMERNQQNEL